MEPRTWSGMPPTNCDICDCKIKDAFVDGRTGLGPWANMCTMCHASYGCGLGTGSGQKYVLEAGVWVNAEDCKIPQPMARKTVKPNVVDMLAMFTGHAADMPGPAPAPKPMDRPPPRPRAKHPVEEAPINHIGELLEDRTERGKQFRAMIGLCDPVIDGPMLMREFGFTSEQVVKHCKAKGRQRPTAEDDVPEVRDDIDLGPLR